MTTAPTRVRESGFVPLTRIRLLNGPDADAQRTVRQTLLRLDPDRLLAPFRRESGLAAHAEGYPGWEAEGLDGHIAGHVLSALSMLAAQGDTAARSRAELLVAGLRECQLTLGTGYVGGVPRGAALWDELAAGRIEAGPFHLNGRWVPLYNLHKTLAGLLDAAQLAHLAVAEDAIGDLGAWWLATAAEFDDAALERMLVTEFGGLPDALARLALHRGDRALLDLARRFVPTRLVEPLAAGRDELDGLHANTQIPVIVGCAAIERVAQTLAPDLADAIAGREGAASRAFFDLVARRRSSPLGGDSVREHFPRADDAEAMITGREGPETCNTVNMIRLAGELHLVTDDDSYLQWSERARANHVRSAQHPHHGGLVYFTSHRPAHYRVFSPEAEGFWCCMGTGFEAHAGHGALVFSHRPDGALGINALVAAEAHTQGAAVTMRAVTVGAADGEDVWLLEASGADVRVSLLVPDWVDGDARVARSEAVAATAAPGARIAVTLSRGAPVTVHLRRRLRVEPMPGGPAWGCVVDGPDVLALRIPDASLSYLGDGARLGHIASGPLHPLADTPVVDEAAVADGTRLGGGRVRIPTDRGEVDLEPFAGIHDARYTLAWPLARGHPARRRAELAARDAASLALDARTRDVVRFGEQQPESDHRLTATDDDTGASEGVRWRRTRGVIDLVLQDWSGAADLLRLSRLTGDDGRAVRVTVAGDLVHEGAIPPEGTTATLPPRDGEVAIAVRISAVDGGPTPRLTELRLLATEADR